MKLFCLKLSSVAAILILTSFISSGFCATAYPYSDVFEKVPSGLLQGARTPFAPKAPGSNVPPVLSGTPPEIALEDSPYSFTPVLTDPDPDERHKFSILNLPPWAIFDVVTGTISGVPENDDVGLYEDITISVVDGAGAEANLPPFSVTVVNTNDAPTATVVSPTTQMGIPAHTILKIIDDDVDDRHSLSLSALPRDGAVLINTAGRITYIPDTGFYGEDEFDITVKDLAGDEAVVSVNPLVEKLPSYLDIEFAGEDVCSDLSDISDGVFIDIDRDGQRDIVVSEKSTNSIHIYQGNSREGFFNTATYDVGGVPESLLFIDVDSDGDHDLLTLLSGPSGGFSVLFNSGGGDLSAPYIVNLDTLVTRLAALDFNGDEIPDLAAAASTPDSVILLEGLGDPDGNPAGVFVEKDALVLPFSPTSLFAADVDADNNADLILVDSSTGEIWLYSGRGDGAFTASDLIATSTAGENFVAYGDWDKFYGKELFFSYSSLGAIVIGYADGEGGFTNGAALYVTPGFESIMLEDCNEDGFLDLVVSWPGKTVIYFNDRAMGFLNSEDLLVANGYEMTSFGDMSGDMVADVLTIDRYGDMRLFLSDGVSVPTELPEGAAGNAFNESSGGCLIEALFQWH